MFHFEGKFSYAVHPRLLYRDFVIPMPSLVVSRVWENNFPNQPKGRFGFHPYALRDQSEQEG